MTRLLMGVILILGSCGDDSEEDCTQEDVVKYCALNRLECGVATVTGGGLCPGDNSVSRSIDCGDCPMGKICTLDNVCRDRIESFDLSMMSATDMAATTLPSTRKQGAVAASSHTTTSGAGGSLLATFNTLVDAAGKICKEQLLTARCKATTCSGGGATNVSFSNQGPASIDIAGTLYTFTYNATFNRYDPSPLPTPGVALFNPGAQITFNLPSQPPIVLTAPAQQVLTAPSVPAFPSALPIDGTKDFVVDWTGGGVGSMSVSITGFKGSDVVTVGCTVPNSDLHLVIEKAMVQLVGPGQGSWSISSSNQMTVDVNGFTTDAKAVAAVLQNGERVLAADMILTY